MKLVKIDDAWINPDAIALIQKEGEEGTHIFFQNNYDTLFNIPIEKVLQAISGSQEHLDDEQYLQLKSEIDEVKGHIASL